MRSWCPFCKHPCLIHCSPCWCLAAVTSQEAVLCILSRLGPCTDLYVIHCPCLLVLLVIRTITFSMKFHNCTGHAYCFIFEARRIMYTFIVMWVTWCRVSCQAHTLISCGLLRVGTVFMSQLCDSRTEQSFWFYWLNNIMLPYPVWLHG